MKAREVKRAKLVAQYAQRKADLKKAAKELELKGESSYEIYQKLQLLPKNASYIRLHNRCISRIQFREMASAGLIPGVKKASW